MINTTDIVKYLEAAKEERIAAELKLNQIISKETAVWDELAKTYKYLKECLESKGVIEKEAVPQLHFAKSKPALAIEQKANEVIVDVFSKKQPLTIVNVESTESVEMEKDTTVFKVKATDCPGITSDGDTLYHRNRPLGQMGIIVSDLQSTTDFDEAFNWTNIKLIRINNLYVSGKDLTNIMRSIFRTILRNKSIEELKALRTGAKILNKTIEAMEIAEISYIREKPSVVNVKGSSGNKIKGLIYILRCTNHLDWVDSIEFHTIDKDSNRMTY